MKNRDDLQVLAIRNHHQDRSTVSVSDTHTEYRGRHEHLHSARCKSRRSQRRLQRDEKKRELDRQTARIRLSVSSVQFLVTPSKDITSVVMNIFSQLQNRELGRLKQKIPISFALNRYQGTCRTVSALEDDPFLAVDLRGDHMVIASEQGILRVVQISSLKQTYELNAHHNAIFDVKWRPGHEEQAMTGSGDQSFILWDLSRSSHLIHQKSAHLSSIKCLSFLDQNVFATGSRDGAISVWDIRNSSKSAVRVSSISNAHPPLDGLPSSAKKLRPANGRSGSKRQTPIVRSAPSSTVTAVLFQPDTKYLFSAGASDAMIKEWDLRMLRKSALSSLLSGKGKKRKVTSPAATPVRTFRCDNSRHGFSSLALDQENQIYGSRSDHRIYSYNHLTGDLTASFSGDTYRTNNFTRIRIVDDYLVSGSVAGSCPVWLLSDVSKLERSTPCPKDVKPRNTLTHDAEEVTAVEIDPKTMDIFAVSDDQKIHKWSLWSSKTPQDSHH